MSGSFVTPAAPEANADPSGADAYKPAILIPNHNHKDSIPLLLDALSGYLLPCLIVDDGSGDETRLLLEHESRQRGWVRVIRRPVQGGKGAAVMTGLRDLHEHGFTHAIQIDADGQHQPADVSLFLELSAKSPEALVLGCPVFGSDVPWHRLIGRQFSRVLVWLETCSFAIRDPLFGFRVYPLGPTVSILTRHKPGERMDFDPEIAVRLKWAGVPVLSLPSRVIYPEMGKSNFRMVADNVGMVALHLKLLGEGVLRLFSSQTWRQHDARRIMGSNP
jgi:glycosyltransferase involved in cell wall biosynthesis